MWDWFKVIQNRENFESLLGQRIVKISSSNLCLFSAEKIGLIFIQFCRYSTLIQKFHITRNKFPDSNKGDFPFSFCTTIDNWAVYTILCRCDGIRQSADFSNKSVSAALCDVIFSCNTDTFQINNQQILTPDLPDVSHLCTFLEQTQIYAPLNFRTKVMLDSLCQKNTWRYISYYK